ncbi:MAG TPA: DUF5916 domain-containing protein [Gemmatimonadaceae bacterium]|nr:DUF5916 domain-containing protein [Gemmatimonadaceae bacterium]
MLVLTLAATLLAQDTTRTWNGGANQTRVPIPRVDTVAVVDGVLNESVWSHAARLTGFSQYQPVDGRAADEPTEVLVWYAPDAIWFGIRAREVHGDVIRATRANRDNIGSEDHVQILLDTYADRRNAFVFGVNALGVQQDGTRSDQSGGGAGGRSATGGGMRDMNPLEGNVDLNPDFIFESRGRLVDGGYDVEIRIPFKALRYQDADVQNWGIHVLRRVQHSGAQDSWAPARRASASFLSQAGMLEGIRDVRRGLVLEATPTATARADGAENSSGAWRYDGESDFGADVRWGIRQNLTANATVNPDFSQVEADVGQVTLNERFALFYPEKRPFFLDGLELFDTPNQLVYTRRIVAPDGGVKLAGKVGGTNIATLFAADASSTSWSGDHSPFFGVARIRRDLGQSATFGTALTTREDGPDFSRLVGVDARLYHNRLYWAQLHAVQSWTDSGGASLRGSLVEAEWDRTGRAYGFHYRAQATAPDFRAATGFVNRTGTIETGVANRVTFYGAPGALVQTWGSFFMLNRTWDFDRPRDRTIEGSESASPSATLRGGWRLNSSVSRNYFSYAPAQYADYTVDNGVTVEPFVVPGIENDLFSGSVGVTTPTFRLFTASATFARGEAALFREASRGRSTRMDASLDLRPSAGLRTSLQFTHLTLDRDRDGSQFSREVIPRLKIEYQINRAIFVRVIGQYTERSRAPLLSRDGDPILVDGVVDDGDEGTELQADWLFSYRPVPGTLFYIGYGTTMSEPANVPLQDLRRGRDGFFAKVSYLFRR